MSTRTTAKRPKQRTFAVTFTIEGTPYHVSPLPCDPAVGHRAFRFAKQSGDGAIYDLYADRYGLHCQCMGFERHGYCKHVLTLQAAARLFSLLPPTPAAHRSTGDLARNDPDAYAEHFGPADPEAENPAGACPFELPTAEEIDRMAEHFGAA